MSRKPWLLAILALAGLTYFVHQLIEQDPVRIWETLRSISVRQWGLLILLRIAYLVVRTIPWRIGLAALGAPLSLGYLLQVNLAATAVGFVTPLSKAAGEATRVVLTRRAGSAPSLAAVVTGKTIEFLAAAGFIVAGVAVSLVRVPMAGLTRLALASMAIGCVAALAVLLARQRRGLLAFLWRVSTKILPRLAASGEREEYIAATDGLIRDFYEHQRPACFKVFWLHVAAYAIWVLEIHVSFRCLGATDVTLLQSFLVVMLGSLSFLIPSGPGQVGVYEGTYLAIFALVGVPPDAGVAMILLRRALSIGAALAGLACLARMRGRAWEQAS